MEPESLYRAVAPVYDLLSPLWRDWLYRDALRAFDAAILDALPTGGDVLDLGCGTGAVLERLVALDAGFGTYTVIDLTPAMLDRAQAKVGHVPGARFGRLDLRAARRTVRSRRVGLGARAPAEPVTVVAAARARLRTRGRLALFFELDGRSPRARTLRELWWLFGVRLVPSARRGAGRGSRPSAASAASGPTSRRRCTPSSRADLSRFSSRLQGDGLDQIRGS